MEGNNLTQQTLAGPLFHIDIDGVRHVAASVIAAESGYCGDYVARLARWGRIAGRKLGTHWYIDEKSFRTFVTQQEALREERRRQLVALRNLQYHATQSAQNNPT
jgi:hypothetical protein